jgi:type II secretory pathway pseudopilin PulG
VIENGASWLSIFQLLNLHSMRLRLHSRRSRSHDSERGYILLTLLLIICLMVIATAAILPSITFNIKRDREEEMIHRGVQYSRAIRAYYKKFGRYPTKIEDLESSNNMRFLRKRYKDPITGQDFKLLHFGEAKLTFSAGMAGGNLNGASPLNNSSPFGSPPPGNGPGTTGGFSNSGNTLGGSQGSFGNSNSSLEGSASQTQGADTNANPNPNSDATAQTQGIAPAPGDHPGVTGQDQLAGTTFGGGPIVGVVSTSKKDTIREFNHKKKYNDWQFVYDPATDRGGLIMTPNQPPIQGFGQGAAPNLNGQTGGTQGNGTGMNNNNGFGNGGGFNNGGFGNGQAGPQNPPTSGSSPGGTTEPNNPPQ